MRIKHSLIAGALLFSVSGVLAGAGTNGTAEENATAYAEAKARISPIIIDLDPSHNVKSCGFSAGEEYTVVTTTMGYEKDMSTYITMYDCDGIEGAPTYGCGRKYSSSERVVDTNYIQSSGQSHQNWTYTDDVGTTVPAYVDVYSNTFTIPADGIDGNPWAANNGGHGGDQAVVRWWQYADGALGESVSLLIGVEASRHYGENMRRVGALIASDLNASADNTACADNK